ncbi:MAG TPA: ribbon-helix-helix domain-containing protein [Methylomirabilota bacterium]|nr:ribbon-helix-helix domain-containing protein [Methylomirabilota bacterium]
MADKGDVTIKIPRQLYEKLQTIIADTGFHSVTEFIVYVLRDLVSTDVTSTGKSGQKKEAASPERNEAGLTAEEIRLIRKRLHDLGYL